MEANKPVESIDGIYESQKGEKGITMLDKIADKVNEEEMITNKITIQKLIEELESFDRKIILLRYYKEKTQTEVAKILGISQVQVSRTERKILNKMKVKLGVI